MNRPNHDQLSKNSASHPSHQGNLPKIAPQPPKPRKNSGPGPPALLLAWHATSKNIKILEINDLDIQIKLTQLLYDNWINKDVVKTVLNAFKAKYHLDQRERNQ